MVRETAIKNLYNQTLSFIVQLWIQFSAIQKYFIDPGRKLDVVVIQLTKDLL